MVELLTNILIWKKKPYFYRITYVCIILQINYLDDRIFNETLSLNFITIL